MHFTDKRRPRIPYTKRRSAKNSPIRIGGTILRITNGSCLACNIGHPTDYHQCWTKPCCRPSARGQGSSSSSADTLSLADKGRERHLFSAHETSCTRRSIRCRASHTQPEPGRRRDDVLVAQRKHPPVELCRRDVMRPPNPSDRWFHCVVVLGGCTNRRSTNLVQRSASSGRPGAGGSDDAKLDEDASGSSRTVERAIDRFQLQRLARCGNDLKHRARGRLNRNR